MNLGPCVARLPKKAHPSRGGVAKQGASRGSPATEGEEIEARQRRSDRNLRFDHVSARDRRRRIRFRPGLRQAECGSDLHQASRAHHEGHDPCPGRRAPPTRRHAPLRGPTSSCPDRSRASPNPSSGSGSGTNPGSCPSPEPSPRPGTHPNANSGTDPRTNPDPGRRHHRAHGLLADSKHRRHRQRKSQRWLQLCGQRR